MDCYRAIFTFTSAFYSSEKQLNCCEIRNLDDDDDDDDDDNNNNNNSNKLINSVPLTIHPASSLSLFTFPV